MSFGTENDIMVTGQESENGSGWIPVPLRAMEEHHYTQWTGSVATIGTAVQLAAGVPGIRKRHSVPVGTATACLRLSNRRQSAYFHLIPAGH
jgi:hypothetical protein